MVNSLRAIVWSERGPNGSHLSVTVQTRFASVQKPQLSENQEQILLPLQCQQFARSYNGRLLVNVDIAVREGGAGNAPPQHYHAEIRDLCVAQGAGDEGRPTPSAGGEVPVLVGSCLCHQPIPRNSSLPVGAVAYFISLVWLQPACMHIRPCQRAEQGDCVPGMRASALCGASRGATPRLLNNHPLISVCTLQSRQLRTGSCSTDGQLRARNTRAKCDRYRRRTPIGSLIVHRVASRDTMRVSVVFAMRVTVPSAPSLLPAEPVLADPVIVSLTYFRHEVPLLQTPVARRGGRAPGAGSSFSPTATPT